MAHRNRQGRVSDLVNDYGRLRTLPAILSVAFVVSSLYQFGGISTVDLVWLDYSLTTSHAMLGSVAIFAVAFASSETKEFDNYSDSEMAIIAAGPALIIGHQHIQFVHDLVMTDGHTGPVIAFIVTLVSWGVAVR